MGQVLVTGPAEEPITATQQKAYSRIDYTEEDALVATSVTAARKHLEHLTGRAFVSQTWRLTLPAFPAGGVIPLTKTPVVSITSVEYVDVNGAPQAVAASVYQTDLTTEPAFLTVAYGQVWPSARDEIYGAVTVTYVAGYGAAANVPEDLKAAIKILAGYWLERPELSGKGDWPDMPPAVRRLAWHYWNGAYP